MTERSKEQLEQIAAQIVDAMVTVHRELGPGLLESTYQACLTHELRSRDVKVQCEIPMPVRYRELTIDAGYRIDMLVADCIIVETSRPSRSTPFTKLSC